MHSRFIIALAVLSASHSAWGQTGGADAGRTAVPVQEDTTVRVIQLNDAVVVSSVTPVKVVADTVEYNPAAYRLAEDAMLEDILKRIPGMEINGDEVTLHGRPVKQLLIDGERFFAGDIKAGLQNISADMVAKVRAYERESDFTRITGIDDGEKEPVIDLRVKKSVLGSWGGNVTGGYGQYDRYNARLNANKIQKDSQYNILANFNNLNGSISINNASRNQLGGGGAGDVDKRELGFSLSRKSRKLNVDASLNYSGNTRDIVSDRLLEKAYSDGMTSTSSHSEGLNRNHTPKFDARIEWKPRRNITVMFKPSFKYNGNRNHSHTISGNFGLAGELKNTTDNFNLLTQNNFSAGLNMHLAFRNVGKKRGRSLSFTLNPQYSDNSDFNPLTFGTIYPSSSRKDRKVLVDSWNNNFNISGQLAYSEPLGKGFFIQTTLYSQIVDKHSDRKVYNIAAAQKNWTADDPLPWNFRFFSIDNISARGHYMLSNSKATLSLRYNRKNINVTAGVSVSPQFSRLEYRDTLGRDTVVRKKTVFASPNFNMTWHPRKTDKLSISYVAFSTSPGMYSLVPVSSGTNPMYVHYGNENLLPAYTHKIEFSYNTGNALRQSSLVTNMTARFFQNQSSNLVEYDSQSGGTVTIPFNIDGNWDLKGSMAYNKVLGAGFSIVQHASVDYVCTNSFLYDSHTRTSEINSLQRAMAKESFDCQWRCSWLELIGNIGGDITSETCSLRPEMNQLPYTVGAGLKSTFICPWGMRFKADYSFMMQRGFVMTELNRNYHVLNLSLSQPFAARRFIVSVESFDLLGQLPNLTRVFSQTSRSVTMFNGFNRYVILRAVYKFRAKKQ